jgi:hypothetical protein
MQSTESGQHKPRSISFVGSPSGDMECFCWNNVPEDQRESIVGKIIHKIDKFTDCHLDVIYPGDLTRKLRCKEGKKYLFTLTAEHI